jgi:hypothetical protein
VDGLDGWLAGGQSHEIEEEKGSWLYYGIVPAAATEIVLTLGDGPRTIPTTAAGAGGNRVYATVMQAIGEDYGIYGVELHDGRGQVLHVC